MNLKKIWQSAFFIRFLKPNKFFYSISIIPGIIKIIMEDHNNSEDELPKLSLEEENEFKRMKLSLESNAAFPDFKTENLPPEIEGMFLDTIINFQKAFENANKISIYDRLGKPNYKTSSELSDLEINIELDKIIKLLYDNGIGFDCQYKYENKLIYDFITNEFFEFEIDDIQLGNMFMHFSYENFYPNDKEDIKKECKAFWKEFLSNDHTFFNKTDEKNPLKNSKELVFFYNSFDKFKINKVKIKEIIFGLKKESVLVNVVLDFESFLKGEKETIQFKGNSKMELINKLGWKIVFASLI